MHVQHRRRRRRTYHYLVQTYRDGRTVRKVEHYLGPALPGDLTEARASLLVELFAQEFRGRADSVGRTYRALARSTPASIRRKNLDAFETQFTYDSDRIEGSSLTFRDTASLLGEGVTPPRRPVSDVLEALAHRAVCEVAWKEAGPLTLPRLLDWHRQLFERTRPEIAGRVRTYPVRIAQSRFVPPEPFELDRLLSEFADRHAAVRTVMHPVLRAALVHLRLVTIHPFGDGNGRLARIAMNRELWASGFPLFDIPYVRRRSYYTALERSQLTKDEVPFVRWFARRYLDPSSRFAGM